MGFWIATTLWFGPLTRQDADCPAVWPRGNSSCLMMETNNRLRHLAFSVMLVGLAAGCDSDGLPDLVKVRGKVVYNGQPLTEGSIVYLPKDSNVGRQASGAIQADGTFELTTIKKGDGVQKGEYRIAVYVYEPHPGEPGRGAANDEVPREIQRGFKIPEKYASVITSGLTDQVDDNHPGYRGFELAD